MTKSQRQPRPPTAMAPPAAHLRVEPTAASSASTRGYLVMLELELRVPAATSPADELARVTALAAGALGGLHSTGVASGRPAVRDVTATGVADLVTVSATVPCGTWPASARMAAVRAELITHGYEVTTTERRACAEPGCTSDAMIRPGHRDDPSRDWFSLMICGRHNYRTCTACSSVLRLTPSSASGPAPAVSCPVCQARLVEWGGSKLWDVELVTRAR